MSHDAFSILHVLLESIHQIFLLFFCLLLKYSDSATIRLHMSDMSHYNCFIYHLFLSHSCRIRVYTSDFLVFCFVFLLKYSNSNMIQLPMSVMSHLIFSFILCFLVSQTYSEKPNFLMFVIFLLTHCLSRAICSQPQPSPPVAVCCRHCHHHRRHRPCRCPP